MSDEYSEDQLSAVQATTDEWFEAFTQSPAFERLNDSQKRKAGAITDFFARYTHDYLGLPPDQWDCGAVLECCTEILPRKVSADRAFFEAMAPVLSAFFSFLGERSLLPHGGALAEVVEDLADEIVANSEDRSNWGPAKCFVMAAQEAGVDIEEPGALEAYMLQFNLRQVARSTFAGAMKSPFPFPHTTASENPKSRPAVNRYDPCPCGSGRKYKFCCEHKS